VQAGTVDWVIFRRRTGVSPYRHSSQQYTASRAPSEHVGAIMNRVTSYLACRVQCATERAIGSPSEAKRAKNGHIPAPCSDPNGRSGPCWRPFQPLFFPEWRVSHHSHPPYKMTFMRSGRFRIHLGGWFVPAVVVFGEMAAFRRRARRSACIYGRSTHPTPGGDRGRRVGVVWSALCGFWSCPPRAHLRWASLLPIAQLSLRLGAFGE